jgi:hypothetical protein
MTTMSKHNVNFTPTVNRAEATLQKRKQMSRIGLTVLTAVAIAGAQCTPAQTLLFKSGFEPATTLGPVTGTAPLGPEQAIYGSDSSTSFTWPITAFNPNPGLDGIHIVPPHSSTDANANHFINILDTSSLHSGRQSLMLEVQGYADNSCCAQNVLNMVGMSQPINSLYERVWVKLGPEIAQQAAAHPTDFWRDLFEIKTQSDFRIITYVLRTSSNSSPFFLVQSDNGAQNSPTRTFWTSSCPQSSSCYVAVPQNQWFLEEIYLKRSSGSDGQFFFAINGKTIVNRMGPNYGGSISSEPIYQWMIQNEYGNYFPMQEWLDDVELWSSPPCKNLPCGSGGTTNALQPPATLTAVVH